CSTSWSEGTTSTVTPGLLLAEITAASAFAAGVSPAMTGADLSSAALVAAWLKSARSVSDVAVVIGRTYRYPPGVQQGGCRNSRYCPTEIVLAEGYREMFRTFRISSVVEYPGASSIRTTRPPRASTVSRPTMLSGPQSAPLTRTSGR